MVVFSSDDRFRRDQIIHVHYWCIREEARGCAHCFARAEDAIHRSLRLRTRSIGSYNLPFNRERAVATVKNVAAMALATKPGNTLFCGSFGFSGKL